MTRRCLDVVIAAAALIFLSPLLAGISLLIRIKEGSPVFYRQWRAGLGAVPFRMIKFRTMRSNAETIGGTLTYQADPRITPLGRFLRRCKFDEFPQLLNVLRGEMTLIGPRPEVLDWAARYTPEQREVFAAKPGLSDPVQILFRHEQDYLTNTSEYERLVAIKVRKQIEYLRSRTPLSDFAIAARSLRAIFPSKPNKEELSIYSAIRAADQPATTCVAGAMPPSRPKGV
jgi:lipopolysaccharide/colanic/teichoic acid biosynthesis glycosyltransferase